MDMGWLQIVGVAYGVVALLSFFALLGALIISGRESRREDGHESQHKDVDASGNDVSSATRAGVQGIREGGQR
jgi:hypothetical protein